MIRDLKIKETRFGMKWKVLIDELFRCESHACVIVKLTFSAEEVVRNDYGNK